MKLMNTDTADFLTTLLWLNEGNEEDNLAKTGDPTIHKFTPEFTSGVEAFIAGFREYLEKQGFDLDSLDNLERSFGGNVLYSLTGHGCGFFDESDSTLGDDLEYHLDNYSGNKYRFEGLENNLSWTAEGQIDLSYLPQYIEEQRAKLFNVKS